MQPKASRSADLQATIARNDEAARQAQVRSGTAQIGDIFDRNFTDDFFQGRRNAYTSWALPQLDQQYTDAQRQLAFALARQGLGNSSVRGQRTGELTELYDRRRREVGDQALSQETEARNSIEAARADLIRNLNVTGDATGAASGAMSRAEALSAPTPFSPIGQAFTDFTAGLGTQAAMERAAALSGGAIRPRYNTGLFGPSRVVVRG